MDGFKLRVVRGMAITAMTTLIAGCSHSPSASSSGDTQSGSYSSACTTNPYLMKYNCSITRVQAAAENGSADAQYALGYMYYYGIGTVQDKQTAELWIQRSAAQGQPLAKKAWTLINTGATFNDLHRAAAEGTDQGVSDTIVQQEPANVDQMNANKPTAPISKYLPAYHGTSQSSQLNDAPPSSSNNNLSQQKPLKANNTLTTADASLSQYQHGFAKQAVTDPRLAANAAPSASVPVTAQLPEKNNIVTAQDKSSPAVSDLGSERYTVQLMGSNKLTDVKTFIAEHHLGSAATYYETQLNGKPWYMLTYGQYPSERKAENVLAELPKSVKANHPWVKSLAVVQEEVRLQKVIV